MNMQAIRTIVFSAFTAVALIAPGCDQSADGTNTEPRAGAPTPAHEPGPAREAEKYQIRLVDTAFKAVTAMPIDPFIKDVARGQEKVVAACLELGLPDLALGYADQISNWRRGVAYADIAYYLAEKGKAEELQVYMDRARQISKAVSVDQWRRDRIKVRMAQVHALLGEKEESDKLEASFDEGSAERGKVSATEASVGSAGTVGRQMDAIEQLLAAKEFDLIRNAHDALVVLHDEHYANAELRALIEEKIKTTYATMPIDTRIRLLLALAENSAGHNDKAHAVELVDEAQAITDEVVWPLLYYELPVKATLAEARYKAGDHERALVELGAALAHYRAETERIRNFERGRVLRSLAEAYAGTGEQTEAMEVYRLAIEAGSVNPNARTRAEDLAASCLSMALCGVEPDEAMWVRIQEIREGLVEPW